LRCADHHSAFQEDKTEELSRVNLKKERVNVDFPAWMIDDLDKAAATMGVTRQAVIKIWLAERLKIEAA